MNEYLTTEVYSYMLDTKTDCNNLINTIRASFDNYNQQEKIFFLDIIQDLEEIVFNCELYFLQYDKYFRNKGRIDLYRVKQGDTLVSIATKYFGDPTKWQDIYHTNRLTDFDLTNVQTLIIPELTEIDDG